MLDPSSIPIVQDRVEPFMLIDAKDGKYKIPVVVLSEFQYNQLLGDLKTIIVTELRAALEQVELEYVPPKPQAANPRFTPPPHIAPTPGEHEQLTLPLSTPLSFTDGASSATALE